MILVSITGGVLRRYDTTTPDGLTHVARLIPGEGAEEAIEYFRRFPSHGLRVPEGAVMADPYFGEAI